MLGAIIGGAIASGIGGLLANLTKSQPNITKTITTTTQVKKEIHAPFESYQYQSTELYAPQLSIQYPSYAIQIESPHSVISQTKKAEQIAKPIQAPKMFYTPYQYEPFTTIPKITESTGTDFQKIALIAVLGLIGVEIVKKL